MDKEKQGKNEQGMEKIPIFIMGKRYEVPTELTIMKAMEHAGYQYIRGCGCRMGVCGACGTFYRKPGDYKIYSGLACQTVVEPDMYLAQLPFFPANRHSFNLEETKATAEEVHAAYPEVFRCVACNACTKICPAEVQVMDYIAEIKRGDLHAASETSFECIQCGLCASRCMGELPQYHIAQLARRLYGKYVQPRAAHLKARVEAIQSGRYDQLLADLTAMDQAELEKRYLAREREPDLAPPGTWEPEETQYL